MASTKYIAELLIFVKVVESKSFSKAAITLGMSKASVSKQISRLELGLRTKLINRTTRSMSLTETGLAVYEHSVRMAEVINDVDQVVSGLQSEPRGTLKISSSVAFGNMHLINLIPEFLKIYPKIKVELGLNDRYVDIAEEGFDLCVRLAKNPGDNLVARKISKINYVLCASKEYLSNNATPCSPLDLRNHNCITLGYMQPQKTWEFNNNVKIPISGNLVVNSSESLRTAAIEGLGIALLASFAVGADIKSGTLQQILPNDEVTGPFGDYIYAVYLPNRFLSPKVRVFIDFLVEKYAPTAPWDQNLC
jgi:DNA-binding transcriptional LysR family regulator